MSAHAVVAFAGARDHYQLPIALYEAHSLERLVTDLYIPLDKQYMSSFFLTQKMRETLEKRYALDLPSRLVSTPVAVAILELALKLKRTQETITMKDSILGTYAARLAERQEAALFLYSYYAYSGFTNVGASLPYRFIFQVHPHPVEVRQILREEIELTPHAIDSLQNETELTLQGNRFEMLASEPLLANGWVVASSFTKATLVQQGIPSHRIHVIPYGVDTLRFTLRTILPERSKPITILFLGSMVQRKGLSYLLDAIRLLQTNHVRVVLIGRGFRDDRLLADYKDLPIEIHTNLSHAHLVKKIHEADVMVFPSLVEGFAHVILEVMSCGVPVITTPNTCGLDVIRDGIDGFIVPIRNATAIADKLTWGLEHRQALANMGIAAAERARQFTWQRFRTGIQLAYGKMLADVNGNF